MIASGERLTIVDHDPRWAEPFVTIGAAVRERRGRAAMGVDHIGSTAVGGLPAKDVIDIQVTVVRLAVARAWPDSRPITFRSAFPGC